MMFPREEYEIKATALGPCVSFWMTSLQWMSIEFICTFKLNVFLSSEQLSVITRVSIATLLFCIFWTFCSGAFKAVSRTFDSTSWRIVVAVDEISCLPSVLHKV